MGSNCIAIGGLKGWKIVLQYRELYCNEAYKWAEELYCRVLHCIAIYGVQ